MTEQTRTRTCGGVFLVDADLPPDLNGRRVCVCGLVGTPGDTHHPVPDVAEQSAHRRRYGDDE